MPIQFSPLDWTGVSVPSDITTAFPGKGGESLPTASVTPSDPKPRKLSEHLDTVVTVADLIASFDGRPAVSYEQKSDTVNCSFPTLQ